MNDRLSVIGCGNLNRRDDAAGICVIQLLKQDFHGRTPPGVCLFDAGTAGMEVMFQARGSEALVIVDAVQSGSPPGTVFKVPGEELAACPPPSYNLHDFRWDHALYAGKQIFGEGFPEEISVYLIEAADLSLGVGLTFSVEVSVRQVAKQIRHDIQSFLS